MSFNRNTYVTLKNYNKNEIKEKYINSSYEIQKTSYPLNIKREISEILSNYNASGAVATNLAYNVIQENPGLSWN